MESRPRYDNDTSSARNRALMNDGYPRIMSVTGSLIDLAVRGDSVAFPVLFKRAKIIRKNFDETASVGDSLKYTSPRMAANNAPIEDCTSLELELGLVSMKFKPRIQNEIACKVLAM